MVKTSPANLLGITGSNQVLKLWRLILSRMISRHSAQTFSAVLFSFSAMIRY